MSRRAAFETPIRALATLLAVPALLAALALSGCWLGSDQVAGGDDFPNSIQTIGRTAATESSDSTDWNVWKDAPATPPGVYDSTSVPTTPPDTTEDSGGGKHDGLARVTLSGDILLSPDDYVPGADLPGTLRIVDTLAPEQGHRRTVRVQSATSFTARYTTWSTQLPDGRSEVRRVSGRVELSGGGYRVFAFEDADGDSVLTPRAGSRNVARVRVVVVTPSGRVKETLTKVAAGPDLSFDGVADNRLLYALSVETSGKDTVLKSVLKAVEDDSVIYDPKRDSNRVQCERKILRDDGSVEEEFYESVVFPDSSKNYPKRFRKLLTTSQGVLETTLLGRDSLPDFAPGDTGRVRAVFSSSVATDTLESSESIYRVRLSDDSRMPGQNRLLNVDRTRTYRFGQITSLRYSLLPPAPLADGGRPRSGGLSLRLELRPSGWIDFMGTATVTGFTGTWTDSKGDTGVAHFDSAGGRRDTPPPPPP